MTDNKAAIDAERQKFFEYLGSRLIGREQTISALGDKINPFLEQLIEMERLGSQAVNCARETHDVMKTARLLAGARLQKDRAYGALVSDGETLARLLSGPDGLFGAIGDYARSKYEGAENAARLHVG